MKLTSVLLLFLILSSHYIEASQKTEIHGKQLSLMQAQQLRAQRRKKQHQQANLSLELAKIEEKSVNQAQANMKFNPVSIGVTVAKQVISAVTNFAKSKEKEFKEEMAKQNKNKFDSLMRDKKLVQSLVEQDCMFYQNLKHIVNSHLITLDLQLAVVEKAYKPTKSQFRNSKTVMSQYKSLDKIQFTTETESKDLTNDEIANYIRDIRIQKDQIVQLLNKKKAAACSLQGTEFQQSQSVIVNKDLDDVIAKIESEIEPKRQTQKKLLDMVVDKAKALVLKSEKEKQAKEKLEQQMFEYQQIFIRFNKQIEKDQEMLNKNIDYDMMRADFNKLYNNVFKIEITKEFIKPVNKQLFVPQYAQKLGDIIAKIYISYFKANKIEDLRQSVDVKEIVESKLDTKAKALLKIVKVIEYLGYAKQIWDLGLNGVVEGKLDKDQKEYEKIFLELYGKLYELISLQVDYSIASSLETQQTEANQLKHQIDLKFWEFGKLVAKQTIVILVKVHQAGLKQINDLIGNPLDLILSTFEMFTTLYSVFKLWRAKKAQKAEYDNQAIIQSIATENVVMESEYGKCQTMSLLYEILSKQQEYLDKLQPLTDDSNRAAVNQAIKPVIKDYFKELCDVDIYTCIGSFSQKFYEELMGKELANELFQYLMYQSKQGPITHVHATDDQEDEKTLVSLGYQLYTEVSGTQFRVFVCRFCERGSYIDFVRVISGKGYQDINQATQKILAENDVFKGIKDRKGYFTATRLQPMSSNNQPIYFLATREIQLDSGVGDIEANILREFEVYRYVLDANNAKIETKERFQQYSKKRNSWVKENSTEVELNKVLISDKNLLKYTYILITQDSEGTNKCDAKMNTTKKYELFQKQYQLEQAYQSFQVFGYFGVKGQDDQYNELKDLGCKIVYSIKMGDIEKMQNAEFYSFKVDFESRIQLYTQNNYQLVSPSTFELDANQGNFYQIYFKPVFGEYTLDEELMVSGKPHFQTQERSDLISYINGYICRRQIRQNSEIHNAQCIFRDDSLSFKLKSGAAGQSELQNFPKQDLSKKSVINEMQEAIELKALQDAQSLKFKMVDWHFSQQLQSRATVNAALQDLRTNEKLIKALYDYLTAKTKEATFKDLKKLVMFVPVRLEYQCLNSEENYVSVNKNSLQIAEYCSLPRESKNNIPVYKKFYARIAIALKEENFVFKQYPPTDAANFLYLPRLSTNIASTNFDDVSLRIQMDFLVKPIFEFGNMILNGIGFKLETFQFFQKSKVISQYNDKCYGSIIKYGLEQKIQEYATKNGLDNQQIIQYQMLDDLRGVKNLDELRKQFGAQFLTSSTKYTSIEQRESPFTLVESNCIDKDFFTNLFNLYPNRAKMPEMTWFIPARISPGKNYLEFEHVKGADGQVDKLNLKESTIDTQTNMPMHDLYYIEMIYNVKKENIISASNQQHQTLLRYGFRPLTVPKNSQYRPNYLSQRDKKQVYAARGKTYNVIEDITTEELNIIDLNNHELLLNTIQFDIYNQDTPEHPYQRPIAQRIWIRYDPRVPGTYYEKCGFNPHISAQVETPNKNQYDAYTKAYLFRHQQLLSQSSWRFKQHVYQDEIELQEMRNEQNELNRELNNKVNYFLFNN